MSGTSKKDSYDVFISYASKDSNAANTIADKCKNLGLDVWIDSNEIEAGEKWRDKIESAIRSCDVVVIIISKDALSSDWVNKEWSIICEEKWSRPKISILPIKLDNTITPPFLSNYNEYLITNVYDYDEVKDSIVNLLNNKYSVDYKYISNNKSDFELSRLIDRIKYLKKTVKMEGDEEKGSQDNG